MIPLPLLLAAAAHPLMPPNLLHLEKAGGAGLSHETFVATVTQLQRLFAPTILRHGGELAIAGDWDDPTVNALAQRFDSTWVVRVSGGLARRPEMTPDALSLAICHEIGHHLGGFVFTSNDAWSAAEGQSDLFAAQSCARILWGEDSAGNAAALATVDREARTLCDAAWETENKRGLCYRVANASQALTSLFAAARKIPVPRFDTPDATWVPVTNVSHPEPQCRLDTLMAGALCGLTNSAETIVGRDVPQGRNSREAEAQSLLSQCHEAQGSLRGVRPRCWFSPQLEYGGSRIVSLNIAPQNREGGTLRAVGAPLPGDTLSLEATLALGRSQALPHEIPPPRAGDGGEVSLYSAHLLPHRATLAAPLVTGSGENQFLFFAPQALAVGRDVPCGTSFPLEFAWTAGGATTRMQQEIAVGVRQSFLLPAGSVESPIPDGVRELAVGLDVALPFLAVEAMVDIDYSHPFPGDLVWTLRAPSGVVYPVEQSWLGNAGRHQRHFRIPVRESPGSGRWELHVRDTARGDAGTLHTWQLQWALGVCQRESLP